jgi:hypothetical protein
MPRNIGRTGKKVRPKTAAKGKRYRCARCRKRSPRPVLTPAPWYCPACAAQRLPAQAEGPDEQAGEGLEQRPQTDALGLPTRQAGGSGACKRDRGGIVH